MSVISNSLLAPRTRILKVRHLDFPEEDPHRTKISARRLGLPYRQVPMPAKVKRKGFNLFNQSKPSPFDLLPQEILEMIVCLLRTSDFLPLRLVCRRVAVLFHTQRFWRSRFLLHGERGHLHDFMKEQQKIVGRSRRETDWRRVYYKTKSIPRDCNNNITINSRISLWQRMEWFKDMYTMIGPPGSRGSKKGKRVPAKDKAFADSLCWTTVRGQSRCDLARSMQWAPRSIILPRTKHQHTFFDQTVIIHKPVVGLRVSVLRERDVTFITGIELVTEDMASKNTPMGYKIIDKQIIFNIKPQHLRGFRVSAGLGGIHALAIFMGPPMIYERPQVSSWIGSPTGKVSDLFSAEEIGALSGNFDVSRSSLVHVCLTRANKIPSALQDDFNIGRENSI